jgi:hypothetical protein
VEYNADTYNFKASLFLSGTTTTFLQDFRFISKVKSVGEILDLMSGMIPYLFEVIRLFLRLAEAGRMDQLLRKLLRNTPAFRR